MDIDDAFSSELHLKIIRFFHENQGSIDTPRGVSTWIREERAAVKQALDDLAKCGILVAHRAPSTTGYSYTRDDRIMMKVERSLKKRRKSPPEKRPR